MLPIPHRARSGGRPARLARWIPLLILLVGAAASGILALQWANSIGAGDRREFDGAVRESTAAVGSEFARTEDALRGIRGLFASSNRVTAAEFRAYVATLNMRERYPSVRAIAFTSAVPTRDLAQFVATQRRAGDRFSITTAPGSDPRLKGALLRRIVTYVEPPSTAAGRPGYDVTARRAPRIAHDHATDTGVAAFSPKLELQPHVPGVSIALAVYRDGAPVRTVAERRAAIRGWVVARVSGQDFAAGVRAPQARRLGIEIFDGDRAEPRALLARVPAVLPHGTRTRTLHASAGGRQWTVRYAALDAPAGEVREPLAVLLIGLALSALLAALVRTQMAARRRADREVFDRTAQLRATTAELRAANDELEAHSREVEAFARRQRDFVATASHELRTPLTSILGYLELVLGARPDHLHDEERGHLQIVYRSGKRLLAIVSDLLTVDKTDAGAMEIRPAVIDAAALLAPTVDAFAATCAAKGLTLTVEPPAEPVALDVDAERMQQVL